MPHRAPYQTVHKKKKSKAQTKAAEASNSSIPVLWSLTVAELEPTLVKVPFRRPWVQPAPSGAEVGYPAVASSCVTAI